MNTVPGDEEQPLVEHIKEEVTFTKGAPTKKT
jgi:hypothetical protein